MYSKDELKELFQNSITMQKWPRFSIDVFGNNVQKDFRTKPECVSNGEDGNGYYIGKINVGMNIGVFFYDIQQGSVLHKRVGLRKLVHSFINVTDGDFEAALVCFSDDKHWRLSFVCDIKGEKTAPKRYTFVFGDTQQTYRTAISRFETLQATAITFDRIKEAFSVEALAKEFYNDLFNWYLWMVEKAGISFPNNLNCKTETEKKQKDREAVIRLITRLLFCWFIKQKNLIPNEIFTSQWVEKVLQDFDKDSLKQGNYYNAILQNLFFATLNNEILSRKWAELGENGKGTEFYGVKSYYRDDSKKSFYTTDGKALMESGFKKVPYLNGGLFECLDKEESLESNKIEYIDGFSRDSMKSKRAFIPNRLFFSEEEQEPGLFAIFSRYNFTVEENSPLDMEVSLDPELLGKVFENLLAAYNPETNESARKDSGSFYTPREIVNYMVDESLKNYLTSKGLQTHKVEHLFDDVNFDCASYTDIDKSQIVTQLKKIQILDPACGSGAFPMGLLQRIVHTVCKLQPSENVYQLKLDVINNCIYGIDIQPIAMMISKLRFFISLICEQDEIDLQDIDHNYGVNTLPNLETKFVAANSLIASGIRDFQGDWSTDTTLQSLKDELLEIRKSHFKASCRDEKLKKRRADRKKCVEIQRYILESAQKIDTGRIEQYQNQIAKSEAELKECQEQKLKTITIKEVRDLFGDIIQPASTVKVDVNAQKRDELESTIKKCSDDIEKERNKSIPQGFEAAVQQVTKWNPYDQNDFSPFFDAEWMFGVKDGFDIVIGNPPYIQLQKNGGELSKLYQNCGYKTFTPTGDIYSLFYERGIQLLKNKGILCFITSNKWMRAGYGEKMREFFSTYTNPLLLIDFAGVKIFESATVDTNILLLENGKNQNNTFSCIAKDKSCRDNLSIYVRQNGTACSFCTSNSWVILSPIEQSIKFKIEAKGTPLKDWDIQINYGIKTGYNDAFIISGTKRDEILANCKTDDERQCTADLIRPILRGRDIKRYGYNYDEIYLIATFPSKHYDIDQYPAVKNYLLSFGIERLEQTGKLYIINGEKVNARKKTNNKWFETQDSISYWDDFSKQKIIYPDISQQLSFSVDNKNFLLGNTAYFMYCNQNEYLCNVLNSKLINWYYRTLSVQLGANAVRMFTIYVINLPIPLWQNTNLQNNIKTLSNDRVADGLVYELYCLNADEIKYIENN